MQARAGNRHTANSNAELRQSENTLIIREALPFRKDPLDRGIQQPGGGILRHKRRRSNLTCEGFYVHIVVGSDDNDIGLRRQRFYPATDLQTIQAWHHQIHHDKVWFQVTDRLDGFVSVRYVTDHITGGTQESAESDQDARVVIDQQYARSPIWGGLHTCQATLTGFCGETRDPNASL